MRRLVFVLSCGCNCGCTLLNMDNVSGICNGFSRACKTWCKLLMHWVVTREWTAGDGLTLNQGFSVLPVPIDSTFESHSLRSISLRINHLCFRALGSCPLLGSVTNTNQRSWADRRVGISTTLTAIVLALESEPQCELDLSGSSE
jgi:hypothetical protein